MQTITIQIKNVFGTNKAYPVCNGAARFAAIAGTKTLSRTVLAHALALGFNIEVNSGCNGVILATDYNKAERIGQLQIAA